MENNDSCSQGSVSYLLELGFTMEDINEGLEDWTILEAERDLGLRPWEDELWLNEDFSDLGDENYFQEN